jgi:hypothetical protein
VVYAKFGIPMFGIPPFGIQSFGIETSCREFGIQGIWPIGVNLTPRGEDRVFDPAFF